MIYDIAIIGAGPAGATLARVLAGQRPELAILLVDGQSGQRRKPCGGLLAPDAQKALAHFDLVLPKSVLADPQIFAVKTIDLAARRVRYYQRYYLNMDRYAFDRWLLSLIPDSVTVLAGHCREVERQEQLFRIIVEDGGGEQEFSCRHLVGADGAGSLVRRSFFPQLLTQYVAIQQWFGSGGRSKPFYSCIFDAVTSESCSWLIYKDEAVIYGGCFAPRHCRESFARQKARLEQYLGFELGKASKSEACLVNRPRCAADFITGSDGVYLVGEAAGLISPSSFEGISSAIISGSMLAGAFAEAADERRIAALYRRKTGPLRRKLLLKTWKRWFMYTPWARKLIMESGLASIEIQPGMQGRNGEEI